MNESKQPEKNHPQVGSGPTYSDSPSDNVISPITSSPPDTLRTSGKPTAKIINNLTTLNTKSLQKYTTRILKRWFMKSLLLQKWPWKAAFSLSTKILQKRNTTPVKRRTKRTRWEHSEPAICVFYTNPHKLTTNYRKSWLFIIHNSAFIILHSAFYIATSAPCPTQLLTAN